MDSHLQIRQMLKEDVEAIARAFADWGKQREQYVRYWRENQAGARITIVATVDGALAGYANVLWQPDYVPFREADIPEINDMNVLVPFQKRGIGTALIQTAEHIATEHGKQVMGIGFGLTADYGAAQRLYPKLGYVPDGQGAQPSPWGDILFLTKRLA